ncbi:MAG: Fic family protein [Bacteriovorax sp.]
MNKQIINADRSLREWPELKFESLRHCSENFLSKFNELTEENKFQYLSDLAFKRRLFSSSLKHGKSIQEWELANRFLEEKNLRTFLLDRPLIIELNNIITIQGNTKYREQNVFLGPFKAVDTSLVDKKMNDLIEEVNLFIQTNRGPVLELFYLLAKFQSEFISIHPFLNGNGRTCILITDWILASYNFLPQSFESKLDFMVGKFEGQNQSKSLEECAIVLLENVLRSYEGINRF